MKDSVVERFLNKIEITSSCWLWKGAILSTGYGQFYPSPREKMSAHRFSYELFVGPIPAGLVIDHLCRVPACINPDHLEPVTQRENTLRGVSPVAHFAATPICKRGHPFTNVRAKGGRRCLTCEAMLRRQRGRTPEQRAADREYARRRYRGKTMRAL